MNNAKLAAALNTLAMGLGELSEALTEGGVPQAARPATVAPSALPQDAAWEMAQGDPNAPEFPPMEYEDVPLTAETPGLGRCPFHNTPWTVKAGGVSKAGKSYNSFWKCDGKNPDNTFCGRKPVKSWADTHPIAA